MLPYALSLLAGAVLPLAFAPYGWFWLAPLSYAALLYVWRDVRSGRAFWLGFVYGCASFGGGTYWTYIAVREMGGASQNQPNGANASGKAAPASKLSAYGNTDVARAPRTTSLAPAPEARA